MPGEQDPDRLVYSSGGSRDDSPVVVRISTLPPAPRPPPSVAPHSEPVDPRSLCPPRSIRALAWGWSRPGTEATLACPPGTAGTAVWRCRGAEGAAPVQWDSPSPDLSDCQSLWMEKIIRALRKSDTILNQASELMQYVSANALYGGDIKSAINAMTIIGEKMQYQLEGIPTVEQREAMVMELAQSVTKTASALLSDQKVAAWQDLPAPHRKRFLSNFLSAVERTGALLPGALAPDREVSVSSDHLLLTVRRMSFRNIHRAHFPSLASLATPLWREYGDSVEVPALVLMENMDAEGSQVVFLSFRNLERLLGSGGPGQVVNSGVVLLSFGLQPGRPVVREPVAVSLRHRSPGNVSAPRCVLWDPQRAAWSGRHCRLQATNRTHSTCHCSRLGAFALMEDVVLEDGEAKMTFLVTVIIGISVSIVFFVSILLCFVYCYRLKVPGQLKLRLSRAELPCLRTKQQRWSLSDSPTVTEDLFQAAGEPYDLVRNSDFMTLSRGALPGPPAPYTQYPGPPYSPGPPRPQPQYSAPHPVAGPQVQTARRRPPAQPHPYVTPGPPAQHIYMEVDPLYCGQLHCSGLASSDSSQTSSGYSTAPSAHNWSSAEGGPGPVCSETAQGCCGGAGEQYCTVYSVQPGLQALGPGHQVFGPTRPGFHSQQRF